MGEEEIYAALAAINKQRCKPPKPDAELRELSRWAATLTVRAPLATMSTNSTDDWRKKLIPPKKGDPKPVLANAITALRCAPEFEGVLGFNEFSRVTVVLKEPPWPGSKLGDEWTEQEDRLLTEWLQRAGIFVSVETAGQAVQTLAKDRSFHPVRNYLDSLKWDGIERIGNWLNRYLGAELNEYTSAVGARWMISAVARIYEPGSKVDFCLILEGPQGLGKSTALQTLAGEWFTDEIADLGSKDAALQTRGVWIIELSELESITRSDVSRIKAFMSRATDRFRPPYGKRLMESPRQCVFAGSANHNTYLRDETGGRRFWPVACTKILIDDLARDRDQLWAEAVHQYRAGACRWLDDPQLNRLAALEQSDRYEGDPWDGIIARWVEDPLPKCEDSPSSDEPQPIQPFMSTRESVTVEDVLRHAIGKRQDQWTQPGKNRVARSLKSLGWERYRAPRSEGRGWR